MKNKKVKSKEAYSTSNMASFRIKKYIKEGDNVDADKLNIYRGDYTRKHSTIASGATTIGSAERAPDEIIIIPFRVEV
jgi:hypothetical protein